MTWYARVRGGRRGRGPRRRRRDRRGGVRVGGGDGKRPSLLSRLPLSSLASIVRNLWWL
jgi:hypothetical protein